MNDVRAQVLDRLLNLDCAASFCNCVQTAMPGMHGEWERE